jgi:hypothetical protein
MMPSGFPLEKRNKHVFRATPGRMLRIKTKELPMLETGGYLITGHGNEVSALIKQFISS